MILGHSIALDATQKQKRYFAKAAGCDRFTWNLALEAWNNQYIACKKDESEEKPNGARLRKIFNEFKYEAFPWMSSIHRDAHAYPFIRLQGAFEAFFKNPKQTAHPVFYKKGWKESFYVANDKLIVHGKQVRLPVVGWIRLREQLRFTGKIMGAVVFRRADRWFISIQVDVPDEKAKRVRTGNGVIGVDLGIKYAVTLSTGEHIEAPKPLKKALKKLKRLGRKMSRQQKRGKNCKKTVSKIARIHKRIADVRKDFWHKVTTRICRENQAVGIETINVKGMIKNRKLARALSDVAIGMFAPMMSYKAPLYGTVLVKADRWEPSTKRCCKCGEIKPSMTLAERTYVCKNPVCDNVMDRDENAAHNLKNLATRGLRESNNVCGLGTLVKTPCEAETKMLVIQQAETVGQLT